MSSWREVARLPAESVEVIQEQVLIGRELSWWSASDFLISLWPGWNALWPLNGGMQGEAFDDIPREPGVNRATASFANSQTKGIG